MKNESNIQQEVNQTIQSLDNVKRAKTDDFFYARLEERLNRRDTDAKHTLFIRLKVKPALSFAMVVVFVLSLFNIFTIVQYQQQYSRKIKETKEAYIEVVAKEYGLQIPTIYQLNDD